MHALFDKSRATNGWTISSRVLREYIEYFGTKTEQLDMQTKDGKAIFTSFTEKIMDGKGMYSSCEGKAITGERLTGRMQRYSSSPWKRLSLSMSTTLTNFKPKKICTSSSTSEISKP